MANPNEGSSSYVSLYPNIAMFSSSRSLVSRRLNQSRAQGTSAPIAPATPTPLADEVLPSSRRSSYNFAVDDPAIDFLAVLTIINTIFDYTTLAFLIVEGDLIQRLMFEVGLVVPFLLRVAAVYQYYEQASWMKRFLNVFFGSRLGWHEKYDLQVLKQAQIGVQFGFPLVLHSVADLFQHGFTFYSLFILITGGRDNHPEFFIVYALNLVITCLSMLGALLIRVSYGASLVYLSLLTIFATVMVSFVLSAELFNIDIEDKIYVQGAIFPWVRFFIIVISAFTTTAYEVRQQKRIILPGLISTWMGLLTLIDLLAVLLVQFKPEFFIGADQSMFDPDIIVDQIIYANIVYDVYVCLFMLVQYRLLLHGGLS